MKAKLIFNLPEDNWEYTHHRQGPGYALNLQDFSNFLRQIRKHRDLTDEQQQLFDEIDQAFTEQFSDTNYWDE